MNWRGRFLWFAVVLLLLTSRQAPLQDEIGWRKELAQSASLRKESPSAALAYLLRLPNPSTYGAEGQYQRLRATAALEDSLGLWEDADRHLRSCLRHAGRERTANVQLARFSVLFKLDRLDEAKLALDSAKDYLRDADNPLLEAIAVHDTAKLLEQNGHYEEAVGPCLKSIETFRRLQKNAESASVRITLAWALYRTGHYDQAREQYLAAQKEAPAGLQHLSLGHLGNLAYEQQDFAAATHYYRRAAEIAEKVDSSYHAYWLTNEASGWIERGDWKKAAERNALAVHEGEQIVDARVREQILINRARIQAGQGHSSAAMQQLTALVKSAKEPAITVEAYSELSGIFRKLGDHAAARNAYQSGLRVVSEQRTALLDLDNRLSFETTVIRLTQRYIDGLMERGRTEEALQVAEASRARMLRTGLHVNEGKPDEVLRVKDYQDAARSSGSAYLAYWVAPKWSYLWVITGEQFQWFDLPGEPELLRRVEHYQGLVQAREESRSEAAALFQTLITPAKRTLRGIRNIVIAPDGPLYALNFETFRQGTPESPYWIEDVTLTVAPSLGLMLGKGAAGKHPNGILLIGDADEWNPEFQSLLTSRQELDQIQARFPGTEATRLTGAQATPAEYERLAPSGYRYIHFATHAVANRSLPLESAIVLSRGNGRGMLTARDVLATPLSSELVTLSACRSAGARTYAGEGLVGLAWAFLHSGAKSVVAGLWDVNDFSSPLLMSALYNGLTSGVSAPEALRNAKLALIKGQKYADPYFWGPFLLYRGAGAQ